MNPQYFSQSPEILKGFLGYMETVKGRSAHTVDEYFIDLRTFFRFLKQKRGLVPQKRKLPLTMSMSHCSRP